MNIVQKLIDKIISLRIFFIAVFTVCLIVFPQIISERFMTVATAQSSSASADSFDATADYSLENNPNGVWSSGYTSTATLGSSFNLYDTTNGNTKGLYQWLSTVVQASQAPSFSKNLGSTSFYGLEPGEIMLHPGPQNQFGVLRFTVPRTGTYSLDAQFYEGDIGDTTAYILRNNNTSSPLFKAVTTSTNPKFRKTIALKANEKLDFLVGSKGSFYSCTTPLRVKLTLQ
jgi:hypothetical protein